MPTISSHMQWTRRPAVLGMVVMVSVLFTANLLVNTGRLHNSWIPWAWTSESPAKQMRSECSSHLGIAAFLQHCKGPGRYLSYQPPGNGWNNQRAVFETAYAIARLLNRSLIAQPVTAHSVVMAEKKRTPRHLSGYKAFNRLASDKLLPLSRVLDVRKLRSIREKLSYFEWQRSHPEFLSFVNARKWRRKTVCHSAGYGYWVDELPGTSLGTSTYTEAFANQDSIALLRDQAFERNADWTGKCEKEQVWFERNSRQKDVDSGPVLVRGLLNELRDAAEELIYFEEGTLFAMDVRFVNKDIARMAQNWAQMTTTYHLAIQNLAKKAVRILKKVSSEGSYDAIHIRRGDHPIRHVAPQYWLRLMAAAGVSRDLPIFVASDESNRTWFEEIVREGYDLVCIEEVLDFRDELSKLGYPRFFYQDAVGMVEQLVCEASRVFVGSEHSTFSLFVMRQRGEIPSRDGLLLAGTRMRWLGHTTKKQYFYHGVHLPGITDIT